MSATTTNRSINCVRSRPSFDSNNRRTSAASSSAALSSRPLLATLLLSALATKTMTNAAEIVMSPPEGQDCFGAADLMEIGTKEIFTVVPTPMADATLDDTRIYELCTDTTWTFGLEEQGSVSPFFTYTGGEGPLTVVNPNFVLRCGTTGSSDGNCIFKGGGIQLQTNTDRDTILEYVSVLGQDMLGIPNAGDLFPADWMPDTSNMVIQGITFQDSQAVEWDCAGTEACHYAPMKLYGYGQGMKISDCKFVNSGDGRPQAAAILPTYNQRFHDMDELPERLDNPKQEIIIEDCVFENNNFQQGIIATMSAISTPDGLPGGEPGDDEEGFRITLSNSLIKSNTIQGKQLLKIWKGTGSVVDSCFVDNTLGQGDAVITDVFTTGLSSPEGFLYDEFVPANSCGVCDATVYSQDGFVPSKAAYCPSQCKCNSDIAVKRRIIKESPVILKDESTQECVNAARRSRVGLGACTDKCKLFRKGQGQLRFECKSKLCITAHAKQGGGFGAKLKRCSKKRSRSQLWQHKPDGIIQLKKKFKRKKLCMSTTGGTGNPKGLLLEECKNVGFGQWKAGVPS